MSNEFDLRGCTCFSSGYDKDCTAAHNRQPLSGAAQPAPQPEWLEILRKFHLHCAPWTRCESSEILDCHSCSLSNIARAIAAAPVAVPAPPLNPKNACDVCRTIPCLCEVSEDDDAYGEPEAIDHEELLPCPAAPPPLPPPQRYSNLAHCPQCSTKRNALPHSPDCPLSPAALAGETRTAGVGFGEEAWLGLVAKTNESLTLEQRQNITAVLEAVDTALNKDRDGVKAIAARLLKQQQKLAAAESRIAQLERTIEEQTARRMTIRLDEHCVETIEQLTPDGGEEIPFYGIMGGVKLIWVGKAKVEREAALTQAQQETKRLEGIVEKYKAPDLRR